MRSAASTARATAMAGSSTGWCAFRSSGSRLPCSPSPGRAILFRFTPQSFLPEEDQGALFAAMRLPEGASLNRTAGVVAQAEDVIKSVAGFSGVLSVVGFDFLDGVTSPNQAFFVIQLAPYDERTDPARSATAVVAQLRPKLAAINQARRFRSTCRRFWGSAAPAASSSCWRRYRASRRSTSQRSPARSRWPPTPERTRWRVLHLRRRHAASLSQRRSQQGAGAGRRHLRSVQRAAIDDRPLLRHQFNLFGRVWQVNLQADQPYRREIDDIFNVYARSKTGAMVPIRVLGEPDIVQGPQLLTRYNGYRAALIEWRRQTRLQFRSGARRHGGRRGRDVAGGLRL